jgi:hypothetical protein
MGGFQHWFMAPKIGVSHGFQLEFNWSFTFKLTIFQWFSP